MRTKQITLYQFDELPTERAKERARDWMRQGIGEDSYWSESVTDDFKETLKALGFSLSTRHGRDALYWDLNPISAAFDASWRASSMDTAAFLADRPATHDGKPTGNAELHRIADALLAIAAQFPDATGATDAGRHITQTAVFDCGDEESTVDLDDEFNTVVCDLASMFATAVNAEYEYQNSDEQIDESMRINEYEFTEDGERA